MKKKSYKMAFATCLPVILFIVLFSRIGASESCQKDLDYCRSTLEAFVKPTHFQKDSTTKDIVNWWKQKWFHGRPFGLIKADYYLQHMTPDK